MGLGNVAGGVLGVLAAALRFSRGVRYPQLAGRCLLYLALPLAVGAPWGWLVLTLPAWITSGICAWRADRVLAAAGERAPADLPGYRVLPGIW
jgi:protein-S-isoprenylcysteine O-methyltransferase Ste14